MSGIVVGQSSNHSDQDRENVSDLMPEGKARKIGGQSGGLDKRDFLF